MARVFKRTWTTKKGEQIAWVIDYKDQSGKRRFATYKRKKEADAWSDSTGVAVRDGTHIADSATVTVKDAGDRWIASAEAAGLERATIDQYRQHLNLHIDPIVGRLKLSQINAPTVRAFEDRLRGDGRSPTMVRYVARSLGALLADAQERGLIVRNPVRELRRGRRRGERQNQERRNGKLKVGVDIPTRDEIKAIVHAAEGR